MAKKPFNHNNKKYRNRKPVNPRMEEVKLRILELRANEVYFRDIPQILLNEFNYKCNYSWVHKLYKAEMDKLEEQKYNTAKKIYHENESRLRQLTRKYMEEALRGDRKAAELMIKVNDQLLKMSGNYAPDKIETTNITEADISINSPNDERTTLEKIRAEFESKKNKMITN